MFQQEHLDSPTMKSKTNIIKYCTFKSVQYCAFKYCAFKSGIQIWPHFNKQTKNPWGPFPSNLFPDAGQLFAVVGQFPRNDCNKHERTLPPCATYPLFHKQLWLKE